MSQREEVWQQIETLARRHPEWQRLVGQMEVNYMVHNNNDNNEIYDDSDFTFVKVEQESNNQESH